MNTAATPASRASKRQFQHDLDRYAATARQGSRWASNASWRAFGAASSVALLASSGVEAAIVYSGPQNIVLAPVNGQSTTIIDIDGGGDDIAFINAGFTYTAANTAFVTGLGVAQIATVSGAYGPQVAKKFSSGQMIGTPNSSLGQGTFNSAFLNSDPTTGFDAGFTSSTGFMGVQLASGNFAWIQVHTQESPTVVTIVDWAYDDSGAHLLAGQTGPLGQTPIPATPLLLGMGLLAMGANGVRTLRRRKREAAASDSNEIAVAVAG